MLIQVALYTAVILVAGWILGFLLATLFPRLFVAPAAALGPDDLTKISGVGKTIETKLHKMGITQYSQIAEWSKRDMTAVDEKLNFKGRIEREDWIAQAKVLAAGGETEFSKRK